jgi:hypothetical protein
MTARPRFGRRAPVAVTPTPLQIPKVAEQTRGTPSHPETRGVVESKIRPLFFSISAAAASTGVSRDYWVRLVTERKIGYVVMPGGNRKRSAKRLIPASEVDRVVASWKVVPALEVG